MRTTTVAFDLLLLSAALFQFADYGFAQRDPGVRGTRSPNVQQPSCEEIKRADLAALDARHTVEMEELARDEAAATRVPQYRGKQNDSGRRQAEAIQQSSVQNARARYAELRESANRQYECQRQAILNRPCDGSRGVISQGRASCYAAGEPVPRNRSNARVDSLADTVWECVSATARVIGDALCAPAQASQQTQSYLQPGRYFITQRTMRGGEITTVRVGSALIQRSQSKPNHLYRFTITRNQQQPAAEVFEYNGKTPPDGRRYVGVKSRQSVVFNKHESPVITEYDVIWERATQDRKNLTEVWTLEE